MGVSVGEALPVKASGGEGTPVQPQRQVLPSALTLYTCGCRCASGGGGACRGNWGLEGKL